MLAFCMVFAAPCRFFGELSSIPFLYVFNLTKINQPLHKSLVSAFSARCFF